MMPLAFCRECGQEYVPVRLRETEQGRFAEPREISDRTPARASERLLLLLLDATRGRAPTRRGFLERFPADWLDPLTGAVRQRLRDRLPRPITLDDRRARLADRARRPLHPGAVPVLPELRGGVRRDGSIADFGKLSSLGAGGRSTSTTVLGLSGPGGVRRAASRSRAVCLRPRARADQGHLPPCPSTPP